MKPNCASILYSRNTSVHLTEAELDELLIAEGEPESALDARTVGHLRSCDTCQARYAEFTGSLIQFNQATLAWSEARSSRFSFTLLRRLAEPPRFQLSFAEFGPIAAAILVAVGMIANANLGHLSAHSDSDSVPGPAIASASMRQPGSAQVALESRRPAAVVQARAAHPAAALSGAPDAGAGAHDQEIASDNQILFAIDSALATPEPAPIDVDQPPAASTNPGPSSDLELRND